ncbi:MAG: hypothetical protein LBO05_08995 [Deltaproteobacteria bacterium]|jgi:hypothetical protein|nr:hypothetical protein [Deltaproteobacteria bacterium]
MSEAAKTVFDPGATRQENDGAPDRTTLDPDSAETRHESETAAAPEEIQAAPPSAASIFAPYESGDLALVIYRVKSKAIESGGMGRVRRVNRAGWNSDLAMKHPGAEFFVSEKHKADFTRECDEWIKLGLHPNIVSCYYAREIDGVPSISGGAMRRMILRVFSPSLAAAAAAGRARRRSATSLRS